MQQHMADELASSNQLIGNVHIQTGEEPLEIALQGLHALDGAVRVGHHHQSRGGFVFAEEDRTWCYLLFSNQHLYSLDTLRCCFQFPCPELLATLARRFAEGHFGVGGLLECVSDCFVINAHM